MTAAAVVVVLLYVVDVLTAFDDYDDYDNSRRRHREKEVELDMEVVFDPDGQMSSLSRYYYYSIVRDWVGVKINEERAQSSANDSTDCTEY